MTSRYRAPVGTKVHCVLRVPSYIEDASAIRASEYVRVFRDDEARVHSTRDQNSDVKLGVVIDKDAKTDSRTDWPDSVPIVGTD